jgi:hypothetical protein
VRGSCSCRCCSYDPALTTQPLRLPPTDASFSRCHDRDVLRVQLRLAGTAGWTVFDLTDAPGVTLDADRVARVLG